MERGRTWVFPVCGICWASFRYSRHEAFFQMIDNLLQATWQCVVSILLTWLFVSVSLMAVYGADSETDL